MRRIIKLEGAGMRVILQTFLIRSVKFDTNLEIFLYSVVARPSGLATNLPPLGK